jgi:hypothetical protein
MSNALKAMGLTLTDYSTEELHAAEVAAARCLATRARLEVENEKAMHAHTQQARAIAFYDKAKAEKVAASANHQAKDSMYFGWMMAAAAAVVALWALFHSGVFVR